MLPKLHYSINMCSCGYGKDMFRDTQVTSASGMPTITVLDEFLWFKADMVSTQMPTDIGQALGSKGVRQQAIVTVAKDLCSSKGAAS